MLTLIAHTSVFAHHHSDGEILLASAAFVFLATRIWKFYGSRR